MVEVSTSILSVKKEDSLGAFYNLEVAKTDYFHIDVMDGKFVEKDTYNKMREYAEYIKRISNLPLDVHLMVTKPIKYIEKYATLNTEFITIHVELGENLIKESFELIKSYGIKCGLAINPDTDISALEPYLDYIDVILVMSVVPGMGGQSFIEESTERLNKIRSMIKDRKIAINIDGGINADTVSKAKGADIVVSGSFVINSDNFQEKIDELRK